MYETLWSKIGPLKKIVKECKYCMKKLELWVALKFHESLLKKSSGCTGIILSCDILEINTNPTHINKKKHYLYPIFFRFTSLNKMVQNEHLEKY